MNWNSNAQRRCIIDATIAPLIEYPRGYANSKQGPFHHERTINSLLNTGDLRMINKPGVNCPAFTARAA